MKSKIFLISALVGLFVTFLFSSLWNFMFLVNEAPGQIFYNRGYPFPFMGFPKGIYLTNFLIDWLIFSIVSYLILFIFNKNKSKKVDKKTTEISWVTVKTFSNRIAAEIAATKLRAYKVDCQISADDAGGMYSFPLQPKSGVELRVLSKDLDRASKLL